MATNAGAEAPLDALGGAAEITDTQADQENSDVDSPVLPS